LRIAASARRAPTARLPLLLCLALALPACGGGGGGGGNPVEPTPPPQPQPAIAFTPQGGGGTSSIVLARGAASTVNTLVLEVRANTVTDLYGLAYDLAYPSGQLQFVRAVPGAFLANGSVQVVATSPGNLVAGGSLLGPIDGVSGSGLLMSLEFTAVAAGGGPITFSRNSAVDSTGDPLAGITWAGGSVLVTR